MEDEVMDPWQRRFYEFARRSPEVLQDIQQEYNQLIRQQISDNDYAAVAKSSMILKSIKYHIARVESPSFFSWNTIRHGQTRPSEIANMYSKIGYERAVTASHQEQYQILRGFWLNEIMKEAKFYNRDFM